MIRKGTASAAPPRVDKKELTLASEECLLQDGNLARVIKLMLRDSVQHEIEIILLTGNALAQAGLGKRRHGLHQRIMHTLGVRDSLTPRHFTWSWDDRKIRHTRRLEFLTSQPPRGRAIPNRDVQHQFPNTVNTRQRLSCSRGRIHILQQLHQGRAMPGVALKRAAKLLGDKESFRSGRSHNL